jgi:putative two-component system response regulator
MKTYLNVSNDQLQQIYTMSKPGVFGLTIVALVVGYLLRNHVDHLLLYGGLTAHLVILIFRVYVISLYKKMSTPNPQQWMLFFTFGTFLSGAAWGGLVIVLNETINIEYQYLLFAIIIGLAGAGIATLGIVFTTYLSFLLPMTLPILVWLLFQEGEIYHIGAGLYLLGIIYLSLTSFRVTNNQKSLTAKNAEIIETQLEIIKRLGVAGEYRDNDTGEHVARMSQNCQLLAQSLGYDTTFCQNILHASPLHDVGKIGISDLILLKPGKLDTTEFDKMQEHAQIGHSILSDHPSKIMQMAAVIAQTHHEKYDGSGYPKGLKAEQIPIEGRIAALCDVYDALSSKRVYKEAWSEDEVLEYITTQSGKHFDPLLVEHFLRILKTLKKA